MNTVDCHLIVILVLSDFFSSQLLLVNLTCDLSVLWFPMGVAYRSSSHYEFQYHVHFALLWFQRTHPNSTLCITFRNILIVCYLPNPQVGSPTRVAFTLLHFQYFRICFSYSAAMCQSRTWELDIPFHPMPCWQETHIIYLSCTGTKKKKKEYQNTLQV